MDVIGLALNFIGSVIIIFFNLPPSISESGTIHLALEQSDAGEIKKAKKYRVISYIGISLLAVGFLLQLLDKCIC
jgi:hypothetical protein